VNLPRMSLHIGDYLKDTRHLRAPLHGAYLLLIMHYWATGGLPDDDQQLASIACMTDPEWKRWRPIIRKLFEDDWKHGRIDLELATAQAKYDKRVKAGKKGGDAKAAAKQKPSNATPPPYQPITLTDNPKEQASARADQDVIDARVAIVQIFEAVGQLPPDTGRVEVWKAQAYDLKLVVATIRASVRHGKTIGNLAFFDNAIREAHEKRNPAPVPAKPIIWDTIITIYAKGLAAGDPFWPPRMGPDPGEAGCRCPPEILRAHGINPETGKLIEQQAA
jgi:uncharacterized protein YdaU (DUF1376 family)